MSQRTILAVAALAVLVGGVSIFSVSSNPSISSVIGSYSQTSAALEGTGSGLVGWWKFDEGSGGTASDSSGSGHTGTIVGTPSYVTGKISGALSFDGSARVTTVGNVNAGDKTLAAWIYPTSVSEAHNQIISGMSTNWWLDLSGNKLDLHPRDNSDNLSNTSLTPNQWYHVVGTCDSSAQRVTLYINGVQDIQVSNACYDNVNQPFAIGSYAGTNSQGFHGIIDDVRIYSRALSGVEVQTLYSSGSGGGGTPDTPPQSGDTTAPSIPAGLTATAVSSSQINLSWTASTDAVGVTGYKIFRNGTQVATSVGTSYSSTGLAASTAYTYTIAAYDAAGNTSTQSSSASATTQAATTGPNYQLNIIKSGSGTITSNPAGISCPPTCGAYFPAGSSVTLQAVADSGNTFWAWIGPCAGTGTCRLTMNGGQSVNAMFRQSFPIVQSQPMPLHNGDVVVLVGDSVTDPHLYSSYLESYYTLMHPDWQLHFRDEGRGGSTLIEVLDGTGPGGDRYTRRVVGHQPDIVSVLIYNGNPTTPEYISQLTDLVNNYIIGRSHARPVILASEPFDTADGAPPIEDLAPEIVKLGSVNNWPYVDLWHFLHPIWFSNHSSWSGGVPTSDTYDLGFVNDRVHPGPAGHLTMTYAILNGLHEDRNVSSATINASNLQVVSSDHATISNIANNTDSTTGIHFTRLDSRLPMAYDDSAAPALQLMPEIYDMSRYMLTVTNLVPGTYDVYVDGIKSATVDSTTLSSGWNMAKMNKGPIHDQLIRVLKRIRFKLGVDTVTRAACQSYIAPNCGDPSLNGWFGVQRYQSNADAFYTGFYNQGLRGAAIDPLMISAQATNESLINQYDALIRQEAQPVARDFKLVQVSTDTSPADTLAPTVSVTVPAPASTVSGSAVLVSATANDNVGVVGVQFKLDGVKTGAEDASAPYSITWDSTSVSNGTHSIVAVARDGSGNVATSSAVTVTVSNQTAQPGPLSLGSRVHITQNATNAYRTVNLHLVPPVLGPAVGVWDTGDLGFISQGPKTLAGITYWFVNFDSSTNSVTNGIKQDGWVDQTLLQPYVTTSRVAPVGANRTVKMYQGITQAFSVDADDSNGDTVKIIYPAATVQGGRLILTSSLPVTQRNASKSFNFIYVPPGGNVTSDSFQYTLSDGVNTSSAYTVTFNLAPVVSSTWIPPIGIPRPEFGIDDTYRMYDTPSNRNSVLTYNVSPDAGYYTHYIDNRSGCADGTNVGTVSSPRCTIPTTLPAGSVVEIHGGPYPNGLPNTSWTGTIDKPIFIRGVGKPRFLNSNPGFLLGNNQTTGGGQYVIVEGLNIFVGSTNRRYRYVAFRNNEVHGDQDGGGLSAAVYDTNFPIADNIVFYKNVIHDNGIWDPAIAVGDRDLGTLVIGFASLMENIWVLDSDMYHNEGDSVQPSAGGQGVSLDPNLHHVYIGRNNMHENKQSATAIKAGTHIIFSQNDMWGIKRSTSSTGAATGFSDDGPDYGWWLFNRIHDSEIGIKLNGGYGPGPYYFIGNLIYAIHDQYGSTGPLTNNFAQVGQAITTWHDAPTYFINNTIYDSDYGLNFWRSSGSAMSFSNNILSKVTVGPMMLNSAYTNVSVRSNLFQGTTTDQSFFVSWRGVLYKTISAFNTGLGSLGGNNQVGNPLFVNPASRDFSLQSASPAINAGDPTLMESAASTFYTLYGSDIRKDFLGNNRPAGGAYDMGAYEYGATGGNQPPPVIIVTPTNGICSAILNVCTAGTFSDVTDSVADYLWTCQGLNGGTDTACRLPMDIADHTSPNITSATSTSVTKTTATISWTTSEQAYSQVEYGLTAPAYGNKTASTSLTTSPSIQLSSLTQGTVYHYRVWSADAAGNTSISDDGYFTTASDVVTPPVIPPTSTTTPPTSTTTDPIPPVVPPVVTPPTGGGNSGGGGGGGSSSGGGSGGSTGWTGTGIRSSAPANVTGTGPLTIGAPKAGGSVGGVTITRVLSLGSSGPDVKLLQQYLNNNGFKIALVGTGSPGKESTYFGPATQSALQKFQCAKAIVCAGSATVNGYGATGPRTRAALKGSGTAVMPPPGPSSPGSGFLRTLQLGSVGADVKMLQVVLNSKGFQIAVSGPGSPGKESTYFGPATKAAVVKYQIANKIVPASGIFGPLTRVKIGSGR